MPKETYKLYNGSIELEYSIKGRGHSYKVDGRIVPGATTILNTINKPALMYWSVNQAIEYLDANLKAGKVYDEMELSELLEDARTAHTRLMKKAGTKGSIVHDWIHKYIKWRIENDRNARTPNKP